MQKEFNVSVKLNNVSITKGGIISYNYGGDFNFNVNDFSSKENLVNTIKQEIDSGFFGKDTTPTLLGRHEMAHGIEEILIRGSSKYKNEKERENAWDSCEVAEMIVNKAYTNLCNNGETKKLEELLTNISEYANDNPSDSFAECLCRKSTEKNSLIFEVKRITIELLKIISLGGKI